MANPIDIIITKEAIAAIDIAVSKVDALDKKLQDTAQNFIDSSKKMASASITPSSVNGKGNDNSKLIAELDALKLKYIAIEQQLKKVNETRKKITLQEQVDSRIRRQNATLDAKAISEESDAYQKLAASLAKAQKSAQAIGATYGASSVQFKKASEEVSKLDKELKDIDAGVGKHQRNVGNYASSWNGLGNAFNQLTREAPAFAVSLNTGFMALSNNIPILFDEISKITAANKELAKTGQPVKSVLGQIAGAFFSWGTALSLGVTLLTLYGGTLIDSITGSKKKKEALEKEKKALEEKTKAEQDAREAIANVQAVEISRSQILLETAKNVSLSYQQRSKAVKELQERYPDYLGHLTKEEILAGKTTEAENKLNEALINRGQALAAQNALQTNAEKQLALELELSKVFQQVQKDRATFSNKIIVYTDKEAQAEQFKKEQAAKSRSENLLSLEERMKALRDEQKALIDIYNTNAKYLDVVKETNKEKKTTEKREDIQGIEKLIKARKTVNEELNKSIEGLKTERILHADDAGAVKMINEAIDYLISVRDKNSKIDPVDLNIVNNPEKTKKQIHEVAEELKKFSSSFRTEFFSNSGFGSLETFFDDTFKNLLDNAVGFKEKFAVVFNSVSEVAQDTFNYIAGASQQNFEAEKTRLQDQYDIALKYAGDNKEAQEKLAADLEQKKKEIAVREAKAKQKQAIMNIAIDTAQAIVGAWVNPGFPAAIGLTALLAALGIAQIATVKAQEIPQYWEGGTHDGGLMLVNDGKGANYKETIVTPDGKIMKPQGRNVLMNAPAGTEIYTHEMWQDKLSEMLQGKGIIMMPQNNNSGLSKSDMYDVLSDTLGMQPQYHSNFDADGAVTYIIKGGNKTTNLSKRGNSTKLRFS